MRAQTNTTGYQDIFDDEWNIYPGVAYSSTGLISNLSDLLKWTDAITGSELLSAKSKEEMFTPYKSSLRTVCMLTIAVIIIVTQQHSTDLMQELYLRAKSKVFIAFFKLYAVKSERCKQRT